MPPISARPTRTAPIATERRPQSSLDRRRLARRGGGGPPASPELASERAAAELSFAFWDDAGRFLAPPEEADRPLPVRDEAERPSAPGFDFELLVRRREEGRFSAPPPPLPPLDRLALTPAREG